MADHDYISHVLHYYNRYARTYDLSEFVRRGTRNKTVALSGWQPGDRVLDVCTGTGELALAFARRGASVVGVDIARGMLEWATTKRAGSNATWLGMDGVALGFRDRAFDISAISLALHHMVEPVQRRVLSELARVTRKRVVIVEPHAPSVPWLRSAWAVVYSWFDESEYVGEWMRQDFARTCQSVGLRIERTQVTGINRITICLPE